MKDSSDLTTYQSDGKKRIRRAHTKSRFGCQSCKHLRIKCDETKPDCYNCTKRQRKCIYNKTLSGASMGPGMGGVSSTTGSKRITMDVVLPNDWIHPNFYEYTIQPLHDKLLSIIPPKSPPITEYPLTKQSFPNSHQQKSEEQIEQEWMDFYTIHVEEMLHALKRDLWREGIVDLASRVDAVKYAAIAISILYRDYLRDPEAPASEEALFYYNRALKISSKGCSELSVENYEGMFFATILIMACSHCIDFIPYASPSHSGVDVLGLYKGPIYILSIMREYIFSSMITAEMEDPLELEKDVMARIFNNLLEVCETMNEDGEFVEDLGLPETPISPDEYNQHSGGNFIISQEVISYLQLQDPNYDLELTTVQNPQKVTKPPASTSSSSSSVNFSDDCTEPNINQSFSNSSQTTTTKQTLLETITILKITARKVVASEQFSRLLLFPMLLKFNTLTLTKVNQHPFAIVLLVYFLAMQSFDTKFWVKKRMAMELDAWIAKVPSYLQFLLAWPKMVRRELRALENGEIKGKTGTQQERLELFERLIDVQLGKAESMLMNDLDDYESEEEY